MKSKLLALLAPLLLAAAAQAQTVSINLFAGVLRNATGVAIPNNSIIMLVADTGSNGFAPITSSTFLSTGSPLSIGGDDKIIGLFNLDSSSAGTAGSDFRLFNLNYGSGIAAQGNAIQLYWFPSLSTSGVNATAGAQYGTYRSDSASSGAVESISWFAPAPNGSAESLSFATTSVGGTLADSLGWANNVVAAVPEPATAAAILGALGGLTVLIRRRSRQTA